MAEKPAAAATDAVKAGPNGATAFGGSGLDSAGGGKNQPLRGPGVSEAVERLRARYQEISGTDSLPPAFLRKLLARWGPEYLEAKLALAEAWVRDKRAAGEAVTPLRAFLDAVIHDWPAPVTLPPDKPDPAAATQALLQRIEEERRQAAPPEMARRYLEEIGKLFPRR